MLWDNSLRINLELNILLLVDAKQDENFEEWRSFILLELESYVSETERFITGELSQWLLTTNKPRVTTVQFTGDKKIPERNISPSGLKYRNLVV